MPLQIQTCILQLTPMTANNIFIYGDKEIEHLKTRDKRLAEVIDRVGKVQREVIPDLFAALVNSIVGQQISTKAHKTIWERMLGELGEITPARIDSMNVESLQKFGITFKKAEYLKKAAQRVMNGELDIEALRNMPDEEVCARLAQIDGVGIWTAEMLMIFSMQRKNVLSYGDLAILRGMRMVYHHRKITRDMFARYKRRLSPYASVASLYFWAVSGGAIDGMRDYAPKIQKDKTKRIENKC